MATSKSYSKATSTTLNRVIVTPLVSTLSIPPVASQCIDKILIKVFAKGNKKESKIFTLRNIDAAATTSLSTLEGMIKKQISEEVCQVDSFNVGYMQGTSLVTFRSKEDIQEVWVGIKKGKNIMLWCDGLKQKSTVASDSDKIILQSSEEDDDLEDEFRTRKGKRSRSRKIKRKEESKKRMMTLKLL